jgi:hypothetical protein
MHHNGAYPCPAPCLSASTLSPYCQLGTLSPLPCCTATQCTMLVHPSEYLLTLPCCAATPCTTMVHHALFWCAYAPQWGIHAPIWCIGVLFIYHIPLLGSRMRRGGRGPHRPQVFITRAHFLNQSL